jgi:hypothetical protein
MSCLLLWHVADKPSSVTEYAVEEGRREDGVKMKEASLRSPLVRRAIEAINQGDLDEFLALFAPNATVVDEATYSGHEAIRAWAQRETFHVQVRFHVAREKNEEGTIVEGNVQSVGGYSGPATFSFTVEGDRIQRLVIE